jgi:hypothetical protein
MAETYVGPYELEMGELLFNGGLIGVCVIAIVLSVAHIIKRISAARRRKRRLCREWYGVPTYSAYVHGLRKGGSR